ncbi:MAG: DUF3833 domain-containing protein [Pseudomonadales bacterium]
MTRTFVIVSALCLLSACSQVQVADYSQLNPVLEPQVFFDGQLTAHGVVKNRKGKVIRTFNADIKASWENGVGTLVEDFVFDDGETQQRIWTLAPNDNGTYRGTAGDVVGDGSLHKAGNSIFLDYILRIPYGDGTVDVRVDDRMYLVTPDVLINESRMSKFGLRVGSILLTIIRHEKSAV